MEIIVGSRVSILIPSLHGLRRVVGRVTAIAGEVIEVKTQNDGYHVVHANECTVIP